MDIEAVSADISQVAVQEQAPAKAMGLDREKEQTDTLDTSNPSVQTITDPNLGQKVNLLD